MKHLPLTLIAITFQVVEALHCTLQHQEDHPEVEEEDSRLAEAAVQSLPPGEPVAVAGPLELPYNTDSIEHMPRNHHMQRKGHFHRNTEQPEQHNQPRSLGFQPQELIARGGSLQRLH